MFDIVYTLTGGGPSRSTTTLVVYIYDTLLIRPTWICNSDGEVLDSCMIATVIMYAVMNKTSDD